jgi:predicted ABC-type ATPase
VNEIVILGGPNGAGKTTAARVLLREFLDLHTFVNADELARGINSPTSDLTGFAAGRLMLQRMRELIETEAALRSRRHVPANPMRNCFRSAGRWAGESL